MDIMLQTLHYGHHIIDIILWTYDCMTLIMVILLREINATIAYQFCSNLSHPSSQCF